MKDLCRYSSSMSVLRTFEKFQSGEIWRDWRIRIRIRIFARQFEVESCEQGACRAFSFKQRHGHRVIILGA